MERTCKVSGKNFSITDNDIHFYTMMNVPLPTLCPLERQRRRWAYRGNKFFLRKCDCCGKTKMAWFSPKITDIKAYCNDCFQSDSWDGLDYGRDFDFNRPFFEQFFELYYEVPKHISNAIKNENSEYLISAHQSKNCYMADEVDDSRDSYFGYTYQRVKDTVEGLYVHDSEIAYQTIKLEDSFKIFFSKNVFNSSNSAFLENCRGCTNCLFCANLENKQYHMFNKAVSKEAFQDAWNFLFSGKRKNFELCLEKFNSFLRHEATPDTIIINSENVSGNYITNSKNTLECFCVDNVENCKFSSDIHWSKNCYDINIYEGENCYECNHVGPKAYKNRFCALCWFCSEIDYCIELHYSQNCFGCTGMKNKKYCILNKEYSRQDYKVLLEKIIAHMKKTGEWGEFFPIKYSPQPYNLTFAEQLFPMKKKDIQEKGRKWIEEEESFSKEVGEKNIPDDINNLPENIESITYICKESGKKFRFIKQEIAFYKKHQIPLPEFHPLIRITHLWEKMGSRKLVDYSCDDCGKNGKTYPENMDGRRVLCESCYKKIIL